jgi:hypothetical protein
LLVVGAGVRVGDEKEALHEAGPYPDAAEALVGEVLAATLDWTRVGGRPLPFDRKSPGPCRGCFMFADDLGRHTGRDATVEVCESK